MGKELKNLNKKELEYIIWNFINYFFEDDWESREQLYENLEYLGIPSGTIQELKKNNYEEEMK